VLGIPILRFLGIQPVFFSSGREIVSILWPVTVWEIRKDAPEMGITDEFNGSGIYNERSPRMATIASRTASLLPLLLVIAATSVGCSSLQTSPADLGRQASTPPPAEEDSEPRIVVELRETEEEPERLKAPLKDGMVVQEALKGSGALNRFRRMDIEVVRPVPNDRPLRMPVNFDWVQREVSPATNYSLHPGDTVEVTEDSRTIIDRMVESAMEPLKSMTR
jgi:hypothetical protein